MFGMGPLLRRFAGSIVAVYFLRWGVWALVVEVEQILMSMATTALTWIADHTPAGFPRVEGVYWSTRLLAWEVALDGLVPIAIGLIIGWSILRRRRRPQ